MRNCLGKSIHSHPPEQWEERLLCNIIKMMPRSEAEIGQACLQPSREAGAVLAWRFLGCAVDLLRAQHPSRPIHGERTGGPDANVELVLPTVPQVRTRFVSDPR